MVGLGVGCQQRTCGRVAAVYSVLILSIDLARDVVSPSLSVWRVWAARLRSVPRGCLGSALFGRGGLRTMAQVLPRWLWSVKGASGVGGTALLAVAASWAWTASPPPVVSGGASRRATESAAVRGVSTAASVGAEEAHTGEECDCSPLWACMQAGNGGCELLDKQLRACLARQKLRAIRNGETAHSV